MSNYNNERYEGTPHSNSKEEKSIWKRFLSFVFAWGERKVVSADRYLDHTMELKKAEVAKVWVDVEKTRAETEKTKAEAALLKMEAYERMKGILSDAARLEEEKMKDLPIAEKSDEQKQEDLQNLLEQLEVLRVVHGVEIKISDISDMAGNWDKIIKTLSTLKTFGTGAGTVALQSALSMKVPEKDPPPAGAQAIQPPDVE